MFTTDEERMTGVQCRAILRVFCGCCFLLIMEWNAQSISHYRALKRIAFCLSRHEVNINNNTKHCQTCRVRALRYRTMENFLEPPLSSGSESPKIKVVKIEQ